MKAIARLLAIGTIAAVSGCATNPPSIRQDGRLDDYRFVVIESAPTISTVSGAGGAISTRELSPSGLIEGLLLKRNLIRVSAPSATVPAEQTLVVRWGISGKRDILLGAGGYTQEVTMALVDARTLRPVYTCTAEGIGATEADDIRNAITSCLSQLR